MVYWFIAQVGVGVVAAVSRLTACLPYQWLIDMFWWLK